MKHSFLGLVLGTALAVGSGSAGAAYTPYFGEDFNNSASSALASIPASSGAESSFLVNLVGVGTQTFEGLAPGAVAPLPLTFPGSSGFITATLFGGGEVAEVAPGTTNGFGRYSIPSASSSKYWETDAADFIVRFSSAISAFGFYGVDIGDFGGQVVFDLLGAGDSVLGTVVVPHTSGNNDGSVLFQGVIAGTAAEDFLAVRFRLAAGAGDVFAFDNFTIAERSQIQPPPNGTPEPGTLALLGLALAGTGMARRRK